MLVKHWWEGKLAKKHFALALLKKQNKSKKLLKKCFGFKVIKAKWVRDEKLTNQSS